MMSIFILDFPFALAETIYSANPDPRTNMANKRHLAIEGIAMDVDGDDSDFSWALDYKQVGVGEWTALTSSSASRRAET